MLIIWKTWTKIAKLYYGYRKNFSLALPQNLPDKYRRVQDSAAQIGTGYTNKPLRTEATSILFSYRPLFQRPHERIYGFFSFDFLLEDTWRYKQRSYLK